MAKTKKDKEPKPPKPAKRSSYFKQAFLGLISLGFIGLIVGIIGVMAIFTYYSIGLPDHKTLANYEPPIVTRLYAADGRLMAEFAQEKRVFMPIETMPDMVKNAFIAAEDQNFYNHHGVDYIAITRAAMRIIPSIMNNRRMEGASTITQQVAKNFLLTNEVSFVRKIKEAILATRMERAMSKDRLLELYLNEIYLGQRAYGVAAASLQYFGKSLSELNIAEIAYLAALPKAPNNYHPVRKHDAALARRNWVIDRMAEEGYIDLAAADLAKLTPLITQENDPNRRIFAPYFSEEIRRILAGTYGEEDFYAGGYVVRSTMDPKLQNLAKETLRKGLEAYDQRHGYRGPLQKLETTNNWSEALKAIDPPLELAPDWQIAVVLNVDDNKQTADLGLRGASKVNKNAISISGVKWARTYKNEGYAQGPAISSISQVLKTGDVIIIAPNPEDNQKFVLKQIPDVQGAIMAMDPHTGRVLAMQGGWKYTYGHSEFNRATQALRQPGSAFKPFVYMAALDHGFTPATLVLDAPFVIEDRPGHYWSPSNYSNEYYGPTPIRVGVEKSKNLMTVRLADYLGMDMIAATAKQFGIHEDMPELLSYSLGAGETTLSKLVAAYAVIVNGGKEITPSFIDRIQDRRGHTVFSHDNRTCTICGPKIRWDKQEAPILKDTRKQIADPRTAYQMTSILEGVVQRGTGIRIKSLGRPLAGKTGTTNRSNDTWFIGFSPDLVVGVFVGFDEPRSLGKRETGSSVAVPIFKDFMEQALADEPIIPFRTPPGIRHIMINAKTGTRAKAGDEQTIWEVFLEEHQPTNEIYMLGSNGIDKMPVGTFTPGAPGLEATHGTGGLY